MTTQHSRIAKQFTGSAFYLPAELEAEFDAACAKILEAQEKRQDLLLARLWVDFYHKYDGYFIGVLQ